MVKKAWLFIVVISIIVLSAVCITVIGNMEEKKGEMELNGGKKYFDPSGLVNPELFMSPAYRQRVNSDLIKAAVLVVNSGKETFSIFDAKKDKPYWRLLDSRRVIKYKIENEALYVSGDGEKWEKVKYRLVSDEEHIHEDDPSITVYETIYLECSWFKGEYDIISVPNA